MQQQRIIITSDAELLLFNLDVGMMHDWKRIPTIVQTVSHRILPSPAAKYLVASSLIEAQVISLRAEVIQRLNPFTRFKVSSSNS